MIFNFIVDGSDYLVGAKEFWPICPKWLILSLKRTESISSQRLSGFQLNNVPNFQGNCWVLWKRQYGNPNTFFNVLGKRHNTLKKGIWKWLKTFSKYCMEMNQYFWSINRFDPILCERVIAQYFGKYELIPTQYYASGLCPNTLESIRGFRLNTLAKY